MKNKESKRDFTTEEKIKEAARKIFHQKGYAATKTRDIAQEAGINLALLNYYFRSKEKLFDMVMTESFGQLFRFIRTILNDECTTLSRKIDDIAAGYIDLLTENPNLPIFVLGEMQANPDWFQKGLGIDKEAIVHSVFFRQLREHSGKTESECVDVFHIPLNMLSMLIFPFIGKPVIKNLTGIDDAGFRKVVDERKTLVPMWVKNMLHLTDRLPVL
jgi:AcrR family transcriptional regulator